MWPCRPWDAEVERPVGVKVGPHTDKRRQFVAIWHPHARRQVDITVNGVGLSGPPGPRMG